MQSKTLGTTGLVVSPIGLGLAALGRPGYLNLGHAADLQGNYAVATMEERAHAVLDAAWKEGIRYFDAARSYGRAEAFLASWLVARHIDPASVTIGSKWGYRYTADWQVNVQTHEVKDHSLDMLLRQTAESWHILGAQLDLYQIHSATLESQVLEDRRVLQELVRLRENGLRIGLTLSGPHQAETLQRALDVTVGNERLFDCVQATWNLLEPSAGEALQAAHDVGMGVIVKEALANGRLTERNQEPTFVAKRTLLMQAAARLGVSLDVLALAAVLAQPWVDVVLSGAANVEHLRSNLAASTVRWDGWVDELLGSLAESPAEYWTARAHLRWN